MRSGEFEQNTHRADIDGHKNPKPVSHVFIDFGRSRDALRNFGAHLVARQRLFLLGHARLKVPSALEKRVLRRIWIKFGEGRVHHLTN